MRGSEFDFVITDIGMPTMNGFELLSAIKKDERLRHLPVLMVTAEAKKDDIVRCVQEGAAGYIVKPFSRATLEERLRRARPALSGRDKEKRPERPRLQRAPRGRAPGRSEPGRAPRGQRRAAGRWGLYFGSSTLSTTWITPFDWITSAMVTLAVPPDSSLIISMLPLLVAVSLPPPTAVSVGLAAAGLDRLHEGRGVHLPATT